MTTKPDPSQLMNFVHELHILCFEDVWFREMRAIRWMDAVLPPPAFDDEQPQQTKKEAAE
jgi:hypothetical protein